MRRTHPLASEYRDMRQPSASGWSLLVVALALATSVGCDDSASHSEPVSLSKRATTLLTDPTSLARAVTEASSSEDGVSTGAQVTAVVAAVEATPASVEAAVEAKPEEVDQPDETTNEAPDEQAAEEGSKATESKLSREAKDHRVKRSKRKRKRTRRKSRKTRRKKRSSSRAKPKPELEKEASVPPPPCLDATDLFYRGKQQLSQGNLKAAISSLSASQRLRSSSRTLTKLGQAYFDLGKLRKAEKTLRAAGKNPEAMLLLAALYQQTGKASKSTKVYKAFLNYHPDHRRANWVRGVLKTL